MVGGGYIAAEFAHIAARAGAKVTVLERGERMLTRFDPDLVGWLMEKFSEIGIEVQTGTAVEAIERVGSGFRVRARAKSREIAIDADLVVHAAGRAPDLDAQPGCGRGHRRTRANRLERIFAERLQSGGLCGR
jgi:glutathione reductase (NADPH)